MTECGLSLCLNDFADAASAVGITDDSVRNSSANNARFIKNFIKMKYNIDKVSALI